MLRVEQPPRQAMATKALEHADQERTMRHTLAVLVQSFMASLPGASPTVPDVLCTQLAMMADFVTRCRSGVVRDGYRRELEYAPEPEMPARLAKQLFELLRGVALVCGHEEATQEDYDRIARVALDCIPAARRTVLRTIATLTAMEAEALTTTQVAQTAQYSTAAVRRALEDLQALGILQVTKGGAGCCRQVADSAGMACGPRHPEKGGKRCRNKAEDHLFRKIGRGAYTQ
jgi:DeoR-like helix-turn-helix domain